MRWRRIDCGYYELQGVKGWDGEIIADSYMPGTQYKGWLCRDDQHYEDIRVRARTIAEVKSLLAFWLRNRRRYAQQKCDAQVQTRGPTFWVQEGA